VSTPIIRSATIRDRPFLEAMLIEAAAGPSDRPRTSLPELLADPVMSRYIAGWGRVGDAGVIAEDESGRPLGAAWRRCFTGAEPGYGFVAEGIPEVSLAVAPQARGGGLGTALLEALMAHARAEGLDALSLSVDQENPAARLYERLGFRPVDEPGEHRMMRLDL